MPALLVNCNQYQVTPRPIRSKLRVHLFFIACTRCIALIRSLHNNYSMSPSWIWSDKITNERVALVCTVIITSYPTTANGIIVLVNSQTGFCRRFLYRGLKLKTSCGKFLNLAHYFPYFLANQKARSAIVGAENLLNGVSFFSHTHLCLPHVPIKLQSCLGHLCNVTNYLCCCITEVWKKRCYPFRNALPSPLPIQRWKSGDISGTTFRHCMWGGGRG